MTDNNYIMDVDEGFHVHTQTQNMSFLKMNRYLREKGITNNKFFLALYDKRLAKVNAHAPNLSPDTQKLILAECTRNPWYFIREVARIPIPGGETRFILSPGSLAIVWCVFNSLDLFCLLPRQQGKTISIAVALTWVYDFGTKNTNMLFGNKSLGDAKSNLLRFKNIREKLPKFIKESVINVKFDKQNVESIESTLTQNKIDIHGTPRNYEDADRKGRGMSIPIWWPDEFAFIKYNDTLYSAAVPAVKKSADIAEERGLPHGKIFSSTPSDIDSPPGFFTKTKIVDEACVFTEEMYNWDRSKVLEYIRANSSNDFVFIKYTWRMLGLTNEWYESMCRDLLFERRIIRREVDLEWTKSSDDSYFSEEELDALEVYVSKDPISFIVEVDRYSDMHKKTIATPYMFRGIENLDPDSWYFVGVDVSGGTGRDFSTITITCPNRGLIPVACFKNNTINTSKFRQLIYTLCTKVIPKSILFIENNSYGKVIIDELLEFDDINTRIYFEYNVPDKDKLRNPVVSTNSISYGISTNTATRPIIIGMVRDIFDERPDLVKLPELFDDIKGLIINKTGKIEHGLGTHDDVLMSWLMVIYAVAHGNNITRFYRMVENKTKKNINRALGYHELNTVGIPDGVNLDFQDLVDLMNRGVPYEEAVSILTAKVEASLNKRTKQVNKDIMREINNGT